jgi:integrase
VAAVATSDDLQALARRFVDFGRHVMNDRAKRVKGVDREWSRFRTHIETARFAEKPVEEVTTRDIEEWVEELKTKETQSPRKVKTVKKLDHQTINRIRSLCTQILAAAKQAGLIKTNPAEAVRLPANRRTDDELKYLTIDEQRLIESCEAIPEFDRLMVMFASGTGLSAGEHFHLRRSDLHVDAKPPHVRVRVGAKGHAIPARTVDLLGPSERAARRVLEVLDEYAPENPHGLLFPTPNGKYRQQGKPLGRSESFRLLLETAGIHRDLAWKDLRPTCGVSMATGAWGRRYPLTDICSMVNVDLQHSGRYARFVETHLGAAASKPPARAEAAAPKPGASRAPEPALGAGTTHGRTVSAPVIQNPNDSLAECARDLHKDELELARWLRALERKRQLILMGPPGTGKTYCAERLGRHLISGGTGICELIQFHPSYGYEDFMQGIRPESAADGSLRYPLVEGCFLDFCRRSAGRDRSVLIIDEINRANIGRVLGELLYLLEYRDRAIPLAGGNHFKIPENVVLIGTMNTADRSIALIDHALRRRFAFVTLGPDLVSLARFHEEQATGFDPRTLIEILRRVNRTIEDPHYAVGVSFFMRPDLGTDGTLEDIWRLEIEPYLDELFFDQPAKVAAFRWGDVEGELRA